MAKVQGESLLSKVLIRVLLLMGVKRLLTVSNTHYTKEL